MRYSIVGSIDVNQYNSENGWTFFRHMITGVNSISVAGTGIIDELRLYPEESQMTTFTYAPLVGITSQCDASDHITYFEYDGFGRLSLLRNEDGNILRKYCYNYRGQPENCFSNT